MSDQPLSLTYTNIPSQYTLYLPIVVQPSNNCFVNWGDSSNNIYYSNGNPYHTYGTQTPGAQTTVNIYGTGITSFNYGYYYNDTSFNTALPLLTACNSFGEIGLTNLAGFFMGATNLNSVPSSLPKKSIITNMNEMFGMSTSFNQDISGWIVSNVTNMSLMFYNASSFNQPLHNWNVSKVTDMNAMFFNNFSFNQDISGWIVSNVTNMSNMFYGAKSFNQPFANWDVSKVTNMSFMFNVASSFNQPLHNWNVSKVTNMSLMFYNANSFNQPLQNWNVSKVTNMAYMFYGASSFNQDIGRWNVSNVTNMTGMLEHTALSSTNYDALLNGWVTNLNTLTHNVTLNANGLTYTVSAYDAHVKLTTDVSWNIVGDIYNPGPAAPGPAPAAPARTRFLLQAVDPVSTTAMQLASQMGKKASVTTKGSTVSMESKYGITELIWRDTILTLQVTQVPPTITHTVITRKDADGNERELDDAAIAATAILNAVFKKNASANRELALANRSHFYQASFPDVAVVDAATKHFGVDESTANIPKLIKKVTFEFYRS